MHHLYYDVFQCPAPAPRDSAFHGGRVFDLSAEDLARGGRLAQEDAYKVYMPINLQEAIERSGVLYWPEDRALVSSSIRERGLCLSFGAGAMTGFSLRSNTVTLPVIIEDSPLRIGDILRGAEVH